MSNCAQHKQDLFGETDMKKVAEAIGDLHYKTLADLLNHLADKIKDDYLSDQERGRIKLSQSLLWTYHAINKASYGAERAWKISEPFMRQ